MYGIYANIWAILMVNVTIYGIHGSYGIGLRFEIVVQPYEQPPFAMCLTYAGWLRNPAAKSPV